MRMPIFYFVKIAYTPIFKINRNLHLVLLIAVVLMIEIFSFMTKDHRIEYCLYFQWNELFSFILYSPTV